MKLKWVNRTFILFLYIFLTSLVAIIVIIRNEFRTKAVDQQASVEQVQTTVVPELMPVLPDLPFGGRNLLPTYRLVALYGSPDFRGLGSLGEQSLEETITRVKTVAESYQPYSVEKIIPTFEIITTVASSGLTENGDYSQEIALDKLRPWVDAAKEQGIYVVLDLQPGRTSFAEQVKLYESLLIEPHVGLALDPEWRLLTPQARHLITVGSVTAEELNQTSTWLADLVKTNNLPQKLFLVHQFKKSMINNRELLDTSREELAYMIHVDGFGKLSVKTDTWNVIKENLPTNTYLGWKNFFDEDKPTPTPEQTMSLTPKPWFISYQ